MVKQALAVGLKIRATFQSPAVAAKAPAGLEGVIMDYAKPETIRPALHNAGTIRSQNAFYGCQGNGAVSIVDIRDIAAVAVIVLAATGHEDKSYGLTGGEALTNEQVAEKLSRVAGRKISYVDLPAAELKKGILSAGTPEWSADALLDLQRFYREGKAGLMTDDVERLTGRKPITFDQFARDYAFAFREEAKVAS